MIQGVFITGTDTSVGKTALASALVRQLRGQSLSVGVYKPVASGAEHGFRGEWIWGDVEQLHAALGGSVERDRICPQRFIAPLAPPEAALQEGARVDIPRLYSGLSWWREHCSALVIEGAGGWLSPLADGVTNADFAVAAGYPVIIVGRLGLGTINHVGLTIEAVRSRGLPIAAIVLSDASPNLSDPSRESNPTRIAAQFGISPVVVIEHQPEGDLLQAPGFLKMNWQNCLAPSIQSDCATG